MWWLDPGKDILQVVSRHRVEFCCELRELEFASYSTEFLLLMLLTLT